jgi:hypothetical protein
MGEGISHLSQLAVLPKLAGTSTPQLLQYTTIETNVLLSIAGSRQRSWATIPAQDLRAMDCIAEKRNSNGTRHLLSAAEHSYGLIGRRRNR